MEKDTIIALEKDGQGLTVQKKSVLVRKKTKGRTRKPRWKNLIATAPMKKDLQSNPHK